MSSNPFATRFIRPGAIPYLFLDGDSAEAIIERLRNQNWRGQIIGEHGSGKSTLLATIVPLLEAAGRKLVSFKIGPGERELPRIDRSSLSPATQIVIDGYEQLSWWSRWKIRSLARRRGTGLLVTAHTDVGFPTLYQTKPSEAVARSVADKLMVTLVADGNSSISQEEISNAYRAAGGNVRETLFKLFDLYQRRREAHNS